VKWDVTPELLALISPNPDVWRVENGVPLHAAALAWPRVTGAPLRDWNNAMAMADARGFPDEYKWVDAGNPSADPQIKAWHTQYGSVFPTLAEYAAAVEAVKASGGPITQATVTTAYEEIIAERPAPTVSGEIRPDSSLPTQGTDAVITTVPAPTSAAPQIYPPPGGGAIGTIPPLVSVVPQTQTAVVTPAAPADTGGFVTSSMKWVFIAAGGLFLLVLLSSRRR
jgi:hypothetical protein